MSPIAPINRLWLLFGIPFIAIAMVTPEPFVLGITLASGCVQIMLAIALWRALRYRLDWGFGWLAAAFLLGGVTNLLAPYTRLFEGNPAAGAGFWLTTLTGFGALSCFVTGLTMYLGQKRWHTWRVFALGLLLPPALSIALVLALGSNFGGDLGASLFFIFCATLSLTAARDQQEPGHWVIGLMLLIQPLVLLMALLLETGPLLARAVAAVPFSLLGVALLSISLHRHNRALRKELGARAAAERELQHANEVLEQRVRERTSQLSALVGALESFNGMVSHDLRAPLRNLTSLIEVAEEAAASGDTRELASILQRQRALGTRMATMISDLLTLSRLQKADMRRESVNLAQSAERALDSLTPAQTGDIHQMVSIDVDGQVMADPGLLEQVFANLLGNAIKFALLNETPSVKVRSSHTADRIIVSIEDNGPGFDPKDADQLFKPFRRLHHDVEGTGLGLTIVDRIVRMHDGQVWAEGSPGLGARFSFSLPA